ncbi:MAG: LLM class flavin-dependent oxidoreductase, partial [Solimonas sp.]
GRWTVKSGVLGPTPHRPGGPPIWIAGAVAPARARAGRLFDGWFPNSAQAADYAAQWADVQNAARAAGRNPAELTAAMYLTLAIDDDEDRANAKINAYLEKYYGVPAAETRKRQMSYAGSANGASAWLKAYADAGATHLVLRFAGDHERHLEIAARLRRDLGW